MTHIWDTDASNAPQTPRSGKGVLLIAVIMLVLILIFIAAVSHAAPVRIKWAPNAVETP